MVSNDDALGRQLVSLLGTDTMSRKNAAGHLGDSSREELLEAVALLRRALTLLDAIKAPSELAARTQSLIDALEEHANA